MPCGLREGETERSGGATERSPQGGTRSGTGVFKFCLLLVRRFPTENSHRNIVGTTQIAFHLLLKIGKCVGVQIVIEALLIVPVTSLNLSIVPRSFRTNELVLYLVVSTKNIKGMYTFGLGKVGKLRTVIHLISCSVCAFGCGVWGRCDLGINDSFVPSYALFHLIREAFETLYFLQTYEISRV